jgi:hypothetical protein
MKEYTIIGITIGWDYDMEGYVINPGTSPYYMPLNPYDAIELANDCVYFAELSGYEVDQSELVHLFQQDEPKIEMEKYR